MIEWRELFLVDNMASITKIMRIPTKNPENFDMNQWFEENRVMLKERCEGVGGTVVITYKKIGPFKGMFVYCGDDGIIEYVTRFGFKESIIRKLV